jgi:septation ring formation regulator EzrA
MNKPIQDVLEELAATAAYLRENGRLMREAVNHLIETEERMRDSIRHLTETEERIEKSNRYSQVMIEHIEKAISAALRVPDGSQPPPEG